MIKEEIAPGIVVYSNVIPDSEKLYTDIEEGALSAKISWAAAGVKENSDAKVNTKTRDTSTIGVSYLGNVKNVSLVDNVKELFFINLNNIFFESFDPIEKDYLSSYGIFSEWHDTYGILKYGEGQHFQVHTDSGFSYFCTLSSVGFFNDDYEGGELWFPYLNLKFKAQKGDVIFFPSTYIYAHGSMEVTKGTKYSAVTMYNYNEIGQSVAPSTAIEMAPLPTLSKAD